jgi:hypothetical protein
MVTALSITPPCRYRHGYHAQDGLPDFHDYFD